MKYIEEGSWNDAAADCNKEVLRGYRGHLWTLNSHAEWWNVFNSLTTHILSEDSHVNSNYGLIKIVSTTLLFIGLQQSREVCFTKISQMVKFFVHSFNTVFLVLLYM